MFSSKIELTIIAVNRTQNLVTYSWIDPDTQKPLEKTIPLTELINILKKDRSITTSKAVVQ